MTTFHFISEDGTVEPDPEGTELANVEEAKLQFSKLCGEMLLEAPRAVWEDGTLKLTVTDHSGMVQFRWSSSRSTCRSIAEQALLAERRAKVITKGI